MYQLYVQLQTLWDSHKDFFCLLNLILSYGVFILNIFVRQLKCANKCLQNAD